MYKISITGQLITKWFTEGEKFLRTEITKGLPKDCFLRAAYLRFDPKDLDAPRDPNTQPVLGLYFMRSDSDTTLKEIVPEIIQYDDAIRKVLDDEEGSHRI